MLFRYASQCCSLYQEGLKARGHGIHKVQYQVRALGLEIGLRGLCFLVDALQSVQRLLDIGTQGHGHQAHQVVPIGPALDFIPQINRATGDQ